MGQKNRQYNVKRIRNAGRWTEAKLNGAIMSEIRRMMKLRWIPSREALRKNKVDKFLAKCECCGKVKGLYEAGKQRGVPKKVRAFHADHIIPVVPVDEERGPSAKEIREWAKAGGTVEDILSMIKPCTPDWNVRFDNMFVEEDGFQVLCSVCHSRKTAKENKERVEFKNKIKGRKSKK